MFVKYGPNTRLCKQLWRYPSQVQHHESRINEVLEQLTSTGRWLPNPDDLGVSSALFSLIPSEDHYTARPSPASPYITERLVRHGFDVCIRRVLDMYVTLSGNSMTRSAAGNLFEPLALAMFCRLEGRYPLEPFRNAKQKFELSEFSLTPDPLGGEKLFTDNEQLLKVSVEHPEKLLKPGQKNYPSIDALVIRGHLIHLIQVTIAKSHGIKVKGLEMVRSAFQDSQIKITDWLLILVTEDPSNLSSVNVVGHTVEEQDKVQEWEARLSKYVLKVNKPSLFRIANPPTV